MLCGLSQARSTFSCTRSRKACLVLSVRLQDWLVPGRQVQPYRHRRQRHVPARKERQRGRGRSSISSPAQHSDRCTTKGRRSLARPAGSPVERARALHGVQAGRRVDVQIAENAEIREPPDQRHRAVAKLCALGGEEKQHREGCSMLPKSLHQPGAAGASLRPSPATHPPTLGLPHVGRVQRRRRSYADVPALRQEVRGACSHRGTGNRLRQRRQQRIEAAAFGGDGRLKGGRGGGQTHCGVQAAASREACLHACTQNPHLGAPHSLGAHRTGRLQP